MQSVALSDIQVRAAQPRRSFEPEALEALAESIRQQGVLQPVLLRPVTGGYELIAGERRVRAARLAGLSSVPATVRETPDEEVLLLAALENLQRQDLNPLDEVEATITIAAQHLGVERSEVVPLLHAQRRSPNAAITDRLDRLFMTLGRGSWKSFAANKAGVLKFPDDLLELLRAGTLEYTRAAALARIKSPEQRAQLIARTVQEGLGVREILAASKAPAGEIPTYQRVRSLIDARRIEQLSSKERRRVLTLLTELEQLLGTSGSSSSRS
ncbi:ParB/RepB/Spo0J family partition protein (plasmid) [Deinococcus radiomollis]|uniref:ParB/RepB/Spo0J family partition protein n=1 Tax=Deinococcus radiomollis TaxID=468916 RepID=UPI0038916E4E